MTNVTSNIREVVQTTKGRPGSDGAGVKLTRIIGTQKIDMVDPLLLLDMFSTDKRDNYIGGFPSHPHRGFETVTYLLAGRMRHKDNAGHEGVIEAGGVQWMSAGRGIIHSEMPEQESGALRGFQLWINLSKAEKMNPPAYQEFTAKEIAEEMHADGTRIKVIAGQTDQGTVGPVKNITTDPLYLDIEFGDDGVFSQAVPRDYSAIVYAINGTCLIGENETALPEGSLAVLGDGERINIAGSQNGRVLLIAAKQLGEPVARAGPFVMNTKRELLQAFNDYRTGKF